MKKRKQRHKKKGTVSSATLEKWRGISLPGLFKSFVFALSFGSILLAYLVLVPRVSVDAQSVGDDPSTLSFVIANTGNVPLREVKFSLDLCDIVVGSVRFSSMSRRCGEVYLEPRNCLWCVGGMPVDSKHVLDIREVIDVSKLAPSGRRMPEGSRIGLRMSFQVWLLPVRFEKSSLLILKKSNDGRSYWAQTSG